MTDREMKGQELAAMAEVFVDRFGSKPDCGRGVTHYMPLPAPPCDGKETA